VSQAIHLARLSDGMPGITPAQGAAMAEAGSVCLQGEGHVGTVPMHVDGDFDRDFLLHPLAVDEQMRRSHRFESTMTEKGACGVAVLVIRELTDYTVVEEAARGTHFDYWLGRPGSFLFQDAARLEVSGLRRADESAVRARLRIKKRQIERSEELLPGFVVVVEFSRPAAWVLQR
jgi:hypothetical protein